jgi:hypothetical protein
MSVIDPSGLFAGDRLRQCSDTAQLHWPRLFLASNGFARLELNFHKIIARAYTTFRSVPTESELSGHLKEYVENSLLFVYDGWGQLWGQWDTPTAFLPRFKTASDKRSPAPPEPAFSDWKKRYRAAHARLPKSFDTISEGFLRGVGGGDGVGIGDGKSLCAFDKARVEGNSFLSIEEGEQGPRLQEKIDPRLDWFETFWESYWLSKAKKPALAAFLRQVRTVERFAEIMSALKAQSPEMLSRESSKRPYAATWLNGERWTDESIEATSKPSALDTALGRIYKKES